MPCNCEVCQKRTEPSSYSLTELTDFAQTGDKIQCRVSRKLVDAASLIQNLFPGHTRFAQPEYLGRATDLEITSKECSSEPEPRKEVFVSYAWTSESTVVVDQLEKAFAGRGVSLLRDRNELKYKDAIRAFMQRIGRGKCIVVILSKHYLQSKNCMFELTEIADRGDLRKRVFPVILEDAHIYDAAGRLRYIKHWEEKKKELDAAMKTVSSENLEGIREEIDLFAKIRNTIARIVDVLADMNALTPEQHQGSNFKELLQTLEVRLTE